MQAVALLLEEDQSWDKIKKVLLKDYESLKKKLYNV